MAAAEIPLFPLRTVLFPGGPLPLRIFEARYLDMISNCLKQQRGFGVVLIKAGSEAGPAETHSVGTMAEIVDWYQGSDGLLGVTARGRERFALVESRREKDGLNVGKVQFLPPDPSVPLAPVYEPMARVLREVLDELGSHYQDLERDFDDASWVGCRLAEILPLPPEQKQACLEMSDPVERLDLLRPMFKMNPKGAA